MAELEWDNGLWRLREETEQLVRRTLAVASEFAENVWPSDVELSANPAAAAWQLAPSHPQCPRSASTAGLASLPNCLPGSRS